MTSTQRRTNNHNPKLKKKNETPRLGGVRFVFTKIIALLDLFVVLCHLPDRAVGLGICNYPLWRDNLISTRSMLIFLVPTHSPYCSFSHYARQTLFQLIHFLKVGVARRPPPFLFSSFLSNRCRFFVLVFFVFPSKRTAKNVLNAASAFSSQRVTMTSATINILAGKNTFTYIHHLTHSGTTASITIKVYRYSQNTRIPTITDTTTCCFRSPK